MGRHGEVNTVSRPAIISTMSPMPFIVILLVMGSIKAMPNPQEMNTDDDLTPPNGPTSEDLADNAVPEDNDNKASRKRRAPETTTMMQIVFNTGPNGGCCPRHSNCHGLGLPYCHN